MTCSPPAGLLGGRDEADIDVGEGRHLAATVAADREQQQPLAGGGIVEGMQPLGRKGEQRLEDDVDEIGAGVRRLQTARRVNGKAAGDLGAAGLQRRLEQRDGGRGATRAGPARAASPARPRAHGDRRSRGVGEGDRSAGERASWLESYSSALAGDRDALRRGAGAASPGVNQGVTLYSASLL